MQNPTPSRSPRVHFRQRMKRTKEQVAIAWIEDLKKEIDHGNSLLKGVTPMGPENEFIVTSINKPITHYNLINMLSRNINSLSDKIDAWIKKYKYI